MLPELSDVEARIIGCLIEKSIFTPDQYPLTLNALTNACNQKSSRDPVMSLKPGEVQRVARQLEAKHLVLRDENFRSRVEKYSQRLCNTRYSNIQLDEGQLAVVCLLLLRGPQTPGELRARSGRLHAFADNADVVVALNSLIDGDSDPLVVRLPRRHGRKDSEYMHLLSGPVDIDALAAMPERATAAAAVPRVSVSELAERVGRLEEELAALKRRLAADD